MSSKILSFQISFAFFVFCEWKNVIKQFEKSIFKMSCWEILFFEDRKMSDNCEVLYTITEEDYQNAIILYEMNK